MGSVTLDALIAGLRRRKTPLASESALFLALECAEALADGGPRALALDTVRLDAEGTADVHGCKSSSEAECLRTLGALVKALCEPLPATVREFIGRTGDGSIEHLREARNELEALLVPLNRAAARRVIARLVRDVQRDGDRPTSDAAPAPSPLPPGPSHPAMPAISAVDSATRTNPLGADAGPSSVDTEPDGKPVPAEPSGPSATATVADMTPLPAKLPPPPRLGSLVTIPIGPSAHDDEEHHGPEEHGSDATRTVPDEDPRADASDGPDALDAAKTQSDKTPRRADSTRKPLLFVAAFFVFSVLFFLWRVSHR